MLGYSYCQLYVRLHTAVGKCLGSKGHAHTHSIRYVNGLGSRSSGVSTELRCTSLLLSAPTAFTTSASLGLLTARCVQSVVHTMHQVWTTLVSMKDDDVGGCNCDFIHQLWYTLKY